MFSRSSVRLRVNQVGVGFRHRHELGGLGVVLELQQEEVVLRLEPLKLADLELAEIEDLRARLQ
jgi:hypothetical protein